MDIISKLARVFNGPYRYMAGPNTLGIGAENLALIQPPRAIDQDFNSKRYNVQRSMNTQFPTVPNTGQSLPDYDLRQGGIYLAGTFELAGLIEEYNKRAN